jgi:hypothetical protein
VAGINLLAPENIKFLAANITQTPVQMFHTRQS